MLLRATIPASACPRYTTLTVERNLRLGEIEETPVTIGGTFVQCSVTRDECSLLVPAFAGPTDYHEIGFAFAQPGDYEVRWQFGSTGVSPVDVIVKQSVRVEPATAQDTLFLDRLSESGLLQRLFGRDPFESTAPEFRTWVAGPGGRDHRALLMIREMLEATRKTDVLGVLEHRKTPENALVWADALSQLATEIPESSYSAYAAYYGACCYAGVSVSRAVETIRAGRNPSEPKDLVAEVDRRASLIAQDELARKAEMAFGFAANAADIYLKPRLLLQFGAFEAVRLRAEQADRLWRQALELAPGDRTIEEPISRLRGETEELNRHRSDLAPSDR